MSDRYVTWANDKERLKDMRRRKIGDVKYKIRMAIFTAFWRTLHFTHLAGPYSKTMCYLNLYRKYPDGRCMWCGKAH